VGRSPGRLIPAKALKFGSRSTDVTGDMNSASRALETGAPCGHDHLVEFYDTEAFLVDTVSGLVVPALVAGDAAIVVATAAHRRRFDAAVNAAGIDVDEAVRTDRYLALDAATLLSRFMVDGVPDHARFRETIGAVIERASRGGRQVRVYGEMVALLVGNGDVASALVLEDLWNDVAQIHTFTHLCAYPMRAFDRDISAEAFTRICEQHSTVIPSEGYSLVADSTDRHRAVAKLQQQTAALQAEVLRLRAQQVTCGPRDRAAHQRDRAGDQRDHAGVLRDQAGVLRDRAGERRFHAGLLRDQAGDERDQAGDQRDRASTRRDQAAEQRDQAADRRDQAADRRDEAAESSEASVRAGITTDPVDHSAMARRDAATDRRRASQDRRAGASERNQAELDRDTALADRGSGAGERTLAERDRGSAHADRVSGASERSHAELDRDTAQADRGASARERESALVDDLTGVYLRGAGFVELEREMARARRTGRPLVVAFVDVDHLKGINDSRGHAAGDRMLLEVADTLRAKMRSYDLVIRYGGDEFVCAMAGLDIADAANRVAEVDAALAGSSGHGSVTVGLAELRPDDSLDVLIARADADLYRQRHEQRYDRD